MDNSKVDVMPSETNGVDAASRGLKVIVIGAGIGGLVAAIALRQQGHHVEMYEQSRFNNEIGAAIHITPNAMGALKYIGIDPRAYGAVPLVQTRFLSADNDVLRVTDNAKDAERWQNPWLQAHRAHLHAQLREAAISRDNKGESVKINTDSPVKSTDSLTATITLTDGTHHSADVLVGADGVHSKARAGLVQSPPTTFRTESSAFRFILERKLVEADPITRPLVETYGSMDMWYGSDRKIVLYPTFHNTLLNFVCVHPAGMSDASIDYNKSASKTALLETYKDFHPSILALLEKADPADVKVYPFFDMAQLPTFASERLAVIGDAAHPFTPHLAQGGAMAIEDAISLAIMLDSSVVPAEVPRRLQWYNEARFERASTIQEYSRQVGGDGVGNNSKGKKVADFKVYEYINYGLSHDEVHSSTQLYRRLKWRAQTVAPRWRQTIAFGPLPGPIQLSLSTWPDITSHKSTKNSASILFKTSATLLRNMFPNDRYQFEKPDTIAYATFTVESLQNLTWLGGGGYENAALYIHGVRYTSCNGPVRSGDYCPIMLENLADPIITGREELGMPKLISDIKIRSNTTSYQAEISWRGAQWAVVELGSLQASTDCPASNGSNEGLFVHKYISSAYVDKPDADYDIFHPADSVPAVKSILTADTSSTRLEFHDLGPHSLPTLHPIAGRLAELPMFEIVRATLTEYDGIPDFSKQQRLN